MFSTPYVTVDVNKLANNIKVMHDRLAKEGIEHWPHIKTHKSIEVARKQLAVGAKGITCASLSEAEVFAEAGVGPIFLAYPIVGADKLARYKQLVEKIEIRTIVDSMYVAEGLSQIGEALGKQLPVLIDVDGGSHRGGVQSGEATLAFAQKVKELPGVNIVGLFTYVGDIYGLKTKEAVKAETLREAKLLLDNEALLEENGIEVAITSGGSTLSSYHAKQLRGISESRAGNYVFGDLNAVAHGVYEPEDCALTVHATVVSTTLPGHATIDAGSKALTSDLSVIGPGHGHILEYPDVQITKLNEEHGYLEFDPEKVSLQVGEKVTIVPNHSCVITNLHESIYALKDGKYVGDISIDARGKSY